VVFDVATGRIGFDDGFTVGPGLSMADARAHWPDAPIRDMHTGWMWLGARRVLIGGRAFAVDLGFHRHDLTYELMMVSMMLTLPGDELGWEGWTREAEDQRGAEHEHWLIDWADRLLRCGERSPSVGSVRCRLRPEGWVQLHLAELRSRRRLTFRGRRG
jgi:hypothetical protein